jgi:hypothetical protein
MKYQTIVFFSIIPLALLSIPSLLENVQAQTNSSNQTSSQPSQNINLTAQALMKVDIVELKDTLMNAKVAIVNENLEKGVTDVRDVETQLFLIKPSPTKLLSDLHKVTNAISKLDINKSLNTLTKVQVDILKAENEIFKAAVGNPQLIQHINNNEKGSDEEEDSTDVEEEDSTDVEEDSTDVEEEDSTDVEEEDSTDVKQQFNTMETIIDEEEYYTDIEDTFAGSVKQ